MKQLLADYAREIRALRLAHPDVSEPALAPKFQTLLQNILPTLPLVPPITVVPEFQQHSLGRPDIALKKAGEPARAFVELKQLDKPANPERWTVPHDKRQFQRLKTLKDWAASNFIDIRLFERDRQVADARIVPPPALDPTTSDAKADKLIAAHDTAPLQDLLTRLAITEAPAATSPLGLATNLAHAARLVRATVLDQLAEFAAAKVKDRPLQQVRDEFRNVLYAHPEAGGYRGEFDTLFSAAFAQTLAFGMLLVRKKSSRVQSGLSAIPPRLA